MIQISWDLTWKSSLEPFGKKPSYYIQNKERPQEPNLFWNLPKNEISRRFFMKIFTRSHSSEDLRWISSENLLKIFRRKDFMKILIKTFSSKNLQKIYINFLQKILITFLPKIFLRSLEDLHLISFWDLLVFVLIFSFKKILSNGQKWTEYLFINSSGNLQKKISQKELVVRSSWIVRRRWSSAWIVRRFLKDLIKFWSWD